MVDATLQHDVLSGFSRKRLTALALPALLLVYLTYVFFAFDVPGLMQRARLENATILLGDAVGHKVHVTRDNRAGEIRVSIEGSRRMTHDDSNMPEWVSINGENAQIALSRGHSVTYVGPVATYHHPEFGDIQVERQGRQMNLTLPPSLAGTEPDWINASRSRVTITTPAGRLTATRSRTETFRYFPGWELFFFDFDSAFYGHSFGELVGMATGERVDPARSNIAGMISDFWHNQIWRHKDVAWAIGETILMAFLGTFGGALIALPLAFLAAGNFAPSRAIRFVIRRIFDFMRGVDALIFTIILSRAFGPGPMTGALSILLTDTGTFGKLFSEALENTDQKQIEGIRSTGANSVQRYRFGVIPQVLPVLLSQVLYMFESNTRSATIIGAIVGGGIGLLLTQAIQTTTDWEKVTYYIVLIVLMVIAMDTLSGWLRRRLIKGDGSGK